MTLSLRPGARFFAAFYRWKAPTQRIYTTCYPHNIVRHRACLYTSRSFSCTPLRQQQKLGELGVEDGKAVERFERDGLEKEKEKLEEDGRGIQYAETGGGEVLEEITKQEKQEPQSPDDLQRSVRHLMRHVTSSVAIITAAYVDPETKLQVPLGIAVSSLNTVTLDPPTISFNVRHPSRTLDAIRDANGRFRVHFLDSRPAAASIADSFTRGNHQQAFLERHQNAVEIALPMSPSPPRILDPAVVTALECEVSHEFTVADHIIVVAKVSSVHSQASMKNTLSYLQGQYIKRNGTVVRQHKDPDPLIKTRYSPITHPFWKLPLFHGEAERDSFVDQMKTYLKHNPLLLDLPLGEAAHAVRYNLNLRMGTLGISLTQMIAEVSAQKGREPKMESWQSNLPIRYKFYGRLSPGDIASIVERVKELAREDISYLSSHREKLFSLLGVDPLSTGMLASDIMNPLREEGLLPPFERSNPKSGTKKNAIPDLEHLEQVEYQLREYLQTQDYESACHLSAEELAKNATGETGWAKAYVNLIRARLHVETAPELFEASKFDISGQTTPEEARVVIRRLFSFFQQGGYTIRDILAIPWWEALRRVRVHPMVLGIDPEFIYGKIKYFLSFGDNEKQLNQFFNLILNPMFKKRVDWAELKTLVDDLARKAPLRAITWTRKDILAAMGLSHQARVQERDSPDLTALVTGHTIPKLLRAALTRHYGPGTEGEMEEVVKHL
ncbi:hypothetical protein K505DRAFT_188691, partial [Melanomma pulvis-pyrius CBS 109.77]